MQYLNFSDQLDIYLVINIVLTFQLDLVAPDGILPRQKSSAPTVRSPMKKYMAEWEFTLD